MTPPTINARGVYSHHPLPAGLPQVDRILRGTLEPDAHGWHALEAVVVALAGSEPWLTADGGPLAAVVSGDLWAPSHRALWDAYGLLRAAGDLVAPLAPDVLGAAVAAAGGTDPAGTVAYLVSLWAEGWRDSVGVPVVRAAAMLAERADYCRRADALAVEGARLGLSAGRPLRLVSAPPARVSDLAVGITDADRSDTPPRAAGIATTGEPAQEWCPHAIHRVHHHRGTITTHAVRCERKTCPSCGPRWQAAHVASVTDHLDGADVWQAVVPAATWATVARGLSRKGANYKRVPVPDTDTVLVLSTVALPGAERVAAADVPVVLGDAVAAVVNVPGVRVTGSAAWSVVSAERADAAESLETEGEYLGDARELDRVERVLCWWRAAVERTRDAAGRERLRATDVPPEAVAALIRNRAVVHPDTLAAERAERTRQRKRDRADCEAWADRWQEWCDRAAS